MRADDRFTPVGSGFRARHGWLPVNHDRGFCLALAKESQLRPVVACFLGPQDVAVAIRSLLPFMYRPYCHRHCVSATDGARMADVPS